MRMTLDAVAAATGGTVLGEGHAEVEGFAIDSRTVDPGDMFVALRGRRDGHEFLLDALAQGAAAVLVERPPTVDAAAVLVGDTVGALSDLARFARVCLSATVVAVTGSTGKTSTKDLMAAALSRQFRTVASPASFNNELGVPLTVLSADANTEMIVAEIGARGPGQVAAMAELVRPRVGVVTTVGAAHTELFGSVEAVAQAKAELLEALPVDGTGVVGLDHAWAATLIGASAAPVVTVGSAASADVRVSDVEVDAELRPRFQLDTPWGGAAVRLEMRGAHQAVNAALAVAAAIAAGVDFAEAVAGVTTARGSRWRMEVERTPLGITVLNDAYNANPASMAAALEALAALDVRGRRWAVLGEMAELGDAAGDEHRRAGAHAVALGIDRVVVVGERAAETAAGVRNAGGDAVLVADAGEAVTVLLSDLASDDAVLVKASRVAGLETVAEAVLGHPEPALTRDVTLTDTDANAGPERPSKREAGPER